jgi:cyanate permease
MTTAIRTSGKHGALLIAGILMIATTLRVTFTGAAPLLDTIRLDYGLSTAQTGLLTTLPCWLLPLSPRSPQVLPGVLAWSAACLSPCC